MHSEILNDRQRELLPLMVQFRREYYLVGGTAIALYLGHRRSIDFDLFKPGAINHKRNLDRIVASTFPYQVTRRVTEQMNLIVNEVKLTFFQYPFPIEPTAHFEQTFRLPPLLQLAAMKACALGRRSKWKDYVDLFFLLRDRFTIDDIDYTEQVDYTIPNPPTDEEIKQALTVLATAGLS